MSLDASLCDSTKKTLTELELHTAYTTHGKCPIDKQINCRTCHGCGAKLTFFPLCQQYPDNSNNNENASPHQEQRAIRKVQMTKNRKGKCQNGGYGAASDENDDDDDAVDEVTTSEMFQIEYDIVEESKIEERAVEATHCFNCGGLFCYRCASLRCPEMPELGLVLPTLSQSGSLRNPLYPAESTSQRNGKRGEEKTEDLYYHSPLYSDATTYNAHSFSSSSYPASQPINAAFAYTNTTPQESLEASYKQHYLKLFEDEALVEGYIGAGVGNFVTASAAAERVSNLFDSIAGAVSGIFTGGGAGGSPSTSPSSVGAFTNRNPPSISNSFPLSITDRNRNNVASIERSATNTASTTNGSSRKRSSSASFAARLRSGSSTVQAKRLASTAAVSSTLDSPQSLRLISRAPTREENRDQKIASASKRRPPPASPQDAERGVGECEGALDEDEDSTSFFENLQSKEFKNRPIPICTSCFVHDVGYLVAFSRTLSGQHHTLLFSSAEIAANYVRLHVPRFSSRIVLHIGSGNILFSRFADDESERKLIEVAFKERQRVKGISSRHYFSHRDHYSRKLGTLIDLQEKLNETERNANPEKNDHNKNIAAATTTTTTATSSLEARQQEQLKSYKKHLTELRADCFPLSGADLLILGHRNDVYESLLADKMVRDMRAVVQITDEEIQRNFDLLPVGEGEEDEGGEGETYSIDGSGGTEAVVSDPNLTLRLFSQQLPERRVVGNNTNNNNLTNTASAGGTTRSTIIVGDEDRGDPASIHFHQLLRERAANSGGLIVDPSSFSSPTGMPSSFSPHSSTSATSSTTTTSSTQHTRREAPSPLAGRNASEMSNNSNTNNNSTCISASTSYAILESAHRLSRGRNDLSDEDDDEDDAGGEDEGYDEDEDTMMDSVAAIVGGDTNRRFTHRQMASELVPDDLMYRPSETGQEGPKRKRENDKKKKRKNKGASSALVPSPFASTVRDSRSTVLISHGKPQPESDRWVREIANGHFTNAESFARRTVEKKLAEKRAQKFVRGPLVAIEGMAYYTTLLVVYRSGDGRFEHAVIPNIPLSSATRRSTRFVEQRRGQRHQQQQEEGRNVQKYPSLSLQYAGDTSRDQEIEDENIDAVEVGRRMLKMEEVSIESFAVFSSPSSPPLRRNVCPSGASTTSTSTPPTLPRLENVSYGCVIDLSGRVLCVVNNLIIGASDSEKGSSSTIENLNTLPSRGTNGGTTSTSSPPNVNPRTNRLPATTAAAAHQTSEEGPSSSSCASSVKYRVVYPAGVEAEDTYREERHSSSVQQQQQQQEDRIEGRLTDVPSPSPVLPISAESGLTLAAVVVDHDVSSERSLVAVSDKEEVSSSWTIIGPRGDSVCRERGGRDVANTNAGTVAHTSASPTSFSSPQAEQTRRNPSNNNNNINNAEDDEINLPLPSSPLRNTHAPIITTTAATVTTPGGDRDEEGLVSTPRGVHEREQTENEQSLMNNNSKHQQQRRGVESDEKKMTTITTAARASVSFAEPHETSVARECLFYALTSINVIRAVTKASKADEESMRYALSITKQEEGGGERHVLDRPHSTRPTPPIPLASSGSVLAQHSSMTTPSSSSSSLPFSAQSAPNNDTRSRSAEDNDNDMNATPLSHHYSFHRNPFSAAKSMFDARDDVSTSEILEDQFGNILAARNMGATATVTSTTSSSPSYPLSAAHNGNNNNNNALNPLTSVSATQVHDADAAVGARDILARKAGKVMQSSIDGKGGQRLGHVFVVVPMKKMMMLGGGTDITSPTDSSVSAPNSAASEATDRPRRQGGVIEGSNGEEKAAQTLLRSSFSSSRHHQDLVESLSTPRGGGGVSLSSSRGGATHSPSSTTVIGDAAGRTAPAHQHLGGVSGGAASRNRPLLSSSPNNNHQPTTTTTTTRNFISPRPPPVTTMMTTATRMSSQQQRQQSPYSPPTTSSPPSAPASLSAAPQLMDEDVLVFPSTSLYDAANMLRDYQTGILIAQSRGDTLPLRDSFFVYARHPSVGRAMVVSLFYAAIRSPMLEAFVNGHERRAMRSAGGEVRGFGGGHSSNYMYTSNDHRGADFLSTALSTAVGRDDQRQQFQQQHLRHPTIEARARLFGAAERERRKEIERKRREEEEKQKEEEKQQKEQAEKERLQKEKEERERKEKEQRQRAALLECAICMENYNVSDRRPCLCPSCGNSFCLGCANHLYRCSFCRVELRSASTSTSPPTSSSSPGARETIAALLGGSGGAPASRTPTTTTTTTRFVTNVALMHMLQEEKEHSGPSSN